MSDAILSLEGVGKSYQNAKNRLSTVALQDITLTVNEGEYVCILGRSGCGKSTLLGVLAGFVQPDSGRVVCKGREVEGPDRHRMLMFQDAALFPWLDVQGNVMYGLNFVEGLSQTEKRDRAEKFLDMVGLSNFRHMRIHELSGGMRQRAAIARALAPDPDILLMDEPFSALDAMTREQLYRDVQQIWLKTNKTILMVTHNVRESVCLGNRVVVMETPGCIIADELVDLPFPRGMNDVSLAVTAARISSVLQNDNGYGNGHSADGQGEGRSA